MGLKKSREALNTKLNEAGGTTFHAYVLNHWVEAEVLIRNWRDALKAWEGKETFDRAYGENRMSVRSFDKNFGEQYRKTISDMKINGTNRFRPNSTFTGTFPRDEHAKHNKDFHDANDRTRLYHAQRGIDSSSFAIPSNFASRLNKYQAGLHDLSASLVNKGIGLFDQVHNKEDGAIFAFLPLPEMADQAVLYKLTRAAKLLKTHAPHFYTKVRNLRAEITRVKLAAEFDMSVGYSAVPVLNPTPGAPRFKLRYGLGNTTAAVEGETPNAKLTAASSVLTEMKVNKEIYEARQQAGLNYKNILDRAANREQGNKNEIVIAIRHHAGPFPVYGIRRGDVVNKIAIASGAPVEGAQLTMKFI